MKSSEEIAAYVFKKRDEHLEKKRRKFIFIRKMSQVGSLCCAGIAVTLCAVNLLTELEKNEIEVAPPHVIEQQISSESLSEQIASEDALTTHTTISPENPSEDTSEDTTEQSTDNTDATETTNKNDKPLSSLMETITDTLSPVITNINKPGSTTSTTVAGQNTAPAVTGGTNIIKPSVTTKITAAAPSKPTQTAVTTTGNRLPSLKPPEVTECTTVIEEDFTVPAVTTTTVPRPGDTDADKTQTVVTESPVVTTTVSVTLESPVTTELVPNVTTRPVTQTTVTTKVTTYQATEPTMIVTTRIDTVTSFVPVTSASLVQSAVVTFNSVVTSVTMATNTSVVTSVVTTDIDSVTPPGVDDPQPTESLDDEDVRTYFTEITAPDGKSYTLSYETADESMIDSLLYTTEVNGGYFTETVQIFQISDESELAYSAIIVKFEGIDNYYIYYLSG